MALPSDASLAPFVSVGFHSDEPVLPSDLLEPTASDARELLDLQPDDVIPARTTSELKTAPAATAGPFDNFPEVVRPLLKEFSDVFPTQLPPGLPPERPTDHTIELIDPLAKPPGHRVYRMGPVDDAELRRQLDDLLAHEFIGPAKSPFGAGVTFADKKTGDRRMCIDYRSLNRLTVPDRFPLPRIDDCLDRFARATVFSKIDLRSGFHQIRVAPAHKPRTAFNTRFGSFQFRVMPFGLCNAPSTFQRTMQFVLSDCLRAGYVQVYVDDILIYSRDPIEHLSHIRKVLELLREARLYAKSSKCTFFASEVEFCGFLVSHNGIRPMPDKIGAMENWPVPSDPTGVRKFLGLCGFYQKFIPRFAHIVAPMTDLLRKDTPWKWTSVEQSAFLALKKAMHDHVVLAYPDPTKEYHLHLDASDVAIGATLSQYDDKNALRLIACMSHKLDKAQKGYPVHEREFLALYSALRQWHYLLKGPKVTAYTDNFSLRFIQTQPNLTPKQARWAAELSQYDLTIKHIPGATNTAADALSRIACYAYAFPASIEPDRPASPSVSEDILPHQWQLMPMPHSPVLAGSDPFVDPDKGGTIISKILIGVIKFLIITCVSAPCRMVARNTFALMVNFGVVCRSVCLHPASLPLSLPTMPPSRLDIGVPAKPLISLAVPSSSTTLSKLLNAMSALVMSVNVLKLTAIVALASCIHCLCPLTNGNLFPLTG